MAKRPATRSKANDTAAPAAPKAKRTRAAAAPPAESPVAAAPEESIAPMSAAKPAGTAPHEPTLDDIRRRAYERYLARGGNHGRAFDDWLEAEQELKRKT